VKKQQLILTSGAVILVFLLFFFGRTVSNKPAAPAAASSNTPHEDKPVDVEKMLTHAKERLTPEQVQRISRIENSVVRGDIKNQQIKAYRQLASFWGDSIKLFEPYAYYTAEAAKLENSEKSLTFAAHLFLTNLKTEGDHAMQNWLASNAKVLFEKALEIDPANDSSRIGLGACYIFGNISDNPMAGIAPIREIVEKHPDNLFGHLILGLGGIRSGQFDKAIEHFLVIINKNPDDLEAALNLAEAYDRKVDKPNAVKWYNYVKSKVSNPEAQKELDDRIKANQ
jgi:tetratricopeptide (TPR) repeat protein